MKIINIALLVILVVIIILIGGYAAAGYYLSAQANPVYLLEHPRLAGFFNVSAVCPNVCVANGGVCGKDGRNYCNECVAFQHGAGYAHDGGCFDVYKYNKYGFQLNIPNAWKGFYVDISKWQGTKINGGKIGDYKGVLLVIKNPQTTSVKQYQDIPIMVFTPDVWKMVSGPNPTVSVSAAPIGPEELGENSKYVFATPPRWYGFTDDAGWQEAVDIVKTFKAY